MNALPLISNRLFAAAIGKDGMTAAQAETGERNPAAPQSLRDVQLELMRETQPLPFEVLRPLRALQGETA